MQLYLVANLKTKTLDNHKIMLENENLNKAETPQLNIGAVSGSVVHCKKAPYEVYIGRPSKWGNPFTHLKDGKTLAKHIVFCYNNNVQTSALMG